MSSQTPCPPSPGGLPELRPPPPPPPLPSPPHTRFGPSHGRQLLGHVHILPAPICRGQSRSGGWPRGGRVSTTLRKRATASEGQKGGPPGHWPLTQRRVCTLLALRNIHIILPGLHCRRSRAPRAPSPRALRPDPPMASQRASPRALPADSRGCPTASPGLGAPTKALVTARSRATWPEMMRGSGTLGAARRQTLACPPSWGQGQTAYTLGGTVCTQHSGPC